MNFLFVFYIIAMSVLVAHMVAVVISYVIQDIERYFAQRKINIQLAAQINAVKEADRTGKPSPDNYGNLWWPGGATVSLDATSMRRPCH